MSDYGYSNARVRAWKSNLFDDAFFGKLMEAKDTEAITAIISKTLYQKDLEKGVIKHKGVSGVEEGLKINLISTLQKLRQIIKGNQEADKLLDVILGRWDIFNLKTILRGLQAGINQEEILEQLVPVGALDQVTLQNLAKQPNIKSVISQIMIFSPQFAETLSSGFEEYKDTQNLGKLELKLDKYYFSYILDKVSFRSASARIIKQAISREIDFMNILTLLRLSMEFLNEGVKEQINPEEYFIEGGRQLSLKQLLRLLEIEGIKEIIDALDRTPYYSYLVDGYKNYQRNGSISKIERKLEDFNTRQNIALFRANPLSIATIVAFVWAKINEIINIRIILRGKEVEMPAEQIREALVLV